MPANVGSLPPDALYLGFDSSTQSLKATVIDAELRLYASAIVNFDSELPHYVTKGGVHRDPNVQGRITSPVLMWVEALDLVLNKLAKKKFPFDKVYAISGSAQQYGTVYWAKGALKSNLQNLDPSKALITQLQDAFSIKDSPVWMDSSTAAQCCALEKALGGAANVTSLTGSRAIERSPGPQIRKIYETQENTYHATERVSLVSSFMASLLVGDYVAIDHSDGAVMNLMDLHHRTWSPEALKATAPGLEAKLGPLAPPHAVAGKLHLYYVERTSFVAVKPADSSLAPHVWLYIGLETIRAPWQVPHCVSMICYALTPGLALSRPGDLAISMGTGDTVFGVINNPHPTLEGHIFPNPVDPETYMAMLVRQNGSLTREDIRDQYASGSWDVFSEHLDKTPPLNDGKVGFYYRDPEILPRLPVGYHRYVLEQDDRNAFSTLNTKKVSQFDAAAEVRAIAEGQFLSMRAHAEHIGMRCPPERVIATGGASVNKQLLTLLAYVFGCNVYTAQIPDSAPLGAALRAAQGWLCKKKGLFVPISSILEHASTENAFQCSLEANSGTSELHNQYSELAAVRAQIEQQLLNELRPKQDPETVH